jgi:O-antigen/teichoic acid export membrane protein
MSGPDQARAGGGRAPQRPAEQRVSRNASFALFAQMVGATLTGVLTLFLGRTLSATQFGYFTFGLSVITVATLFADLGVASSAGRFLAERRAEPAEAAAVFRTSLRLKLLVSALASVVLFALAGPISREFGIAAATAAVRGCAIALLGQSALLLLLGAFIALGKLGQNVILATIESVAETIATVVLVVLSATAASAAYGRAIGYTVGLLAGLALARRAIGPLRSATPAADARIVSARRILTYAGPLLVVDAAFRVFSSIDVLLIAALVGGGAQIAAFGLGIRLATFLDFPAAALGSAISPRLARRDDPYAPALLSEGLRVLIILQMMIVAPLLIWPEAIVHLAFGNRYAAAPPVLRALAPYVLLSGIAQPVTLAVNYMGLARWRVPISIAMLAVNVGVDVAFLPTLGIVAGGIGTSAAYAVWVPAHVWLLRRRGAIRVRPLLLTTLRTAVAGAAMAGVLALIGTELVPVGWMVLGAFAGPLAYVAALLLLGELTVADLGRARRLIARRVTA